VEMASAVLPPEANLRPGETLIEQWDYQLTLRDSPVASILARAILTSDRLILLELPTASVAARVSSGVLRKPTATGFMQEMGRWHVQLVSKLADLPEPTLGLVESRTPTALPSRRAMAVGDKRFPVGDDPRAEPMVACIRDQWAAVRRGPRLT
jgi:hypothetical protein